jgi:hypothetical protein
MNVLMHPSKMNDKQLKVAYSMTNEAISQAAKELSADSANLSYSQIKERVGDIENLKHRRQAIQNEALGRKVDLD